MRIIVTVCIVFAMAALLVGAESEGKHNYKPKEGYVPDAETAIAIAVAVWKPIYGKDKIENEKPYQAILASGVWTVESSLPGQGRMVGGVAVAEIAKDDGRILRVSHGK
ncbi:MAG: YbbC/YhhH family protein [Candidatus Riflebacteria bacterium]|nr:YbbC/YhhH family protein [Candidatus Riflebacteria bacterium]